MFTFTNNFVLLSTSNNSDSFISNSNFCFCQHQFVVYSTPNSNVRLLQPICHLFCILFYQQPHATISASIFVFFTTMCLSNSTTYSTFRFCNLSPTSNHLTHFFSNQPSNSIFLFFTFKHFQQFYCLISLPPCFFWIRCAVCRPPILEGSHVEARLFRVLGIVYT